MGDDRLRAQRLVVAHNAAMKAMARANEQWLFRGDAEETLDVYFMLVENQLRWLNLQNQRP